MHGQQNDKYTEMHGQQNDKYTEMHGQQNVKTKLEIEAYEETMRYSLDISERMQYDGTILCSEGILCLSLLICSAIIAFQNDIKVFYY